MREGPLPTAIERTLDLASEVMKRLPVFCDSSGLSPVTWALGASEKAPKTLFYTHACTLGLIFCEPVLSSQVDALRA